MACRGDGTTVPSTKRTQHYKKRYERWTPERVRKLQRYPDATSQEAASLLSTTPEAVRHARSRYGRWPSSPGDICGVCGERPVWAESAAARALHLCKGCWLEEKARRLDERREEVRLRQQELRIRRQEAAGKKRKEGR